MSKHIGEIHPRVSQCFYTALTVLFLNLDVYLNVFF